MRDVLTIVRDELTIVRDELIIVRDELTIVRDVLTIVRDVLTIVRDVLTNQRLSQLLFFKDAILTLFDINSEPMRIPQCEMTSVVT